MFLDLFKFKGEVTDPAYVDTIDILNWSWGVSNNGTFHMGGGGGSGKGEVSDISFTKYVDRATCAIMAACAKGEHIATAKLILRKAGGKPLVYWVMSMSNVIVTSYSTGGAGSADRLTENFSLNFQKFTIEYVKQNEKGLGEKAGNFSWDIAKNATK
jgi:type VI secretion system secreted protein Hcp